MEWKDLTVSQETSKGIEEIKAWFHDNTRSMAAPGMKKAVKSGYKVLFSGETATDKTLTASLLGKEFGQEVYRVDLSKVVSRYIGETEKNLDQLFKKAEEKNWILFFDEAEALFGKRTEVKDSHDKYANQEVAYLLQKAEDFSGLVILATNLKADIDKPFLRRFNSVVRF